MVILFFKNVLLPVLGEIDPADLGRTLTHEHLSMQFDVCFVPPPKNNEGVERLPWQIENLGWIRQFP